MPLPSVTIQKKRSKDLASVDKDCEKQYRKLKSYSLLKEFTQSSTIHGIQHIFREGETPLHRVIWTIFFITCLSGATYLIYDSWSGYITVPIAITVADTNHPLDGVYFPAVTVCPTERIVKQKALQYIADELQDKSVVNDTRIQSFLLALSALQHPTYSNMAVYLNQSQEVLIKLDKINVTDLMLKSMRTCREIFLACYWEGRKVDCCSLFSLQRSEEGFCYSFNSFTSENNNNCVYRDAYISDNCTLLSTANNGPRTGLEVLLKYTKHRVTIRVHHPNVYPEAGLGSLIPIGELDKMNVGVKPAITESSDDIRTLDPEIAGCYFKDSKYSSITKVYSQKSCLLECRMRYLLNRCRCLPYYITIRENATPCSALQLHCIVENTDELRFYRPPSDESKVSDDVKKNSLDCTHCLPTCNERTYDLVVDLTKDVTGRKYNYYAYINVFYRTNGAVRYKRSMTYDYVQLLVNLGGIGGLFLGGSLLSLLEAVYWLTKALLTYLCLPTKKRVLSQKRVNTSKIFITHQNWIN